MPPRVWQPPVTGDIILDRCFSELAGRLDEIGTQIDDLDAPQTRVVSRLTTLVDERFVEWRGGAGEVILPDARYRGSARAGMVTIQNTGIGALTVRAAPRNTVNGLASWPVPMASATIFTANGVDQWSAAGAASPTPSGGGSMWYNGSYLPGIWYPPGLSTASSAYNHELYYGSGTQNGIIWAIPHVFSRAGTLTDISTYGKGSKIYVAVYRDDGTRTSPGERIASAEHDRTGFVLSLEQNNVNLDVSADEMLWFVSTCTSGAEILGQIASSLYPLLGSDMDGTGVLNPLRKMYVGYRDTFTYAQPPATWSPIARLWGGFDENTVGGKANQIPVVFFKFTPS